MNMTVCSAVGAVSGDDTGSVVAGTDGLAVFGGYDGSGVGTAVAVALAVVGEGAAADVAIAIWHFIISSLNIR